MDRCGVVFLGTNSGFTVWALTVRCHSDGEQAVEDWREHIYSLEYLILQLIHLKSSHWHCGHIRRYNPSQYRPAVNASSVHCDVDPRRHISVLALSYILRYLREPLVSCSCPAPVSVLDVRWHCWPTEINYIWGQWDTGLHWCSAGCKEKLLLSSNLLDWGIGLHTVLGVSRGCCM